jgi:hypothetical protein
MKFIIFFLLSIQTFSYAEEIPVWEKSSDQIHQIVLNIEADLVSIEEIFFKNCEHKDYSALIRITSTIRHELTMDQL